ncbi:MAG TPA: hypothetical protein VI434_15740 [Candidatus Dormibacteraeota bacterium]
MPRRVAIVFGLGLVIAACGSPSTGPSMTPVVSQQATPTAAPTPSPSPSPPSLDVTPLIPQLEANGRLDLLQETGTTAFSFPASKAFNLFSPFGDGFLAAPNVNNAPSSMVVIEPDGSLQTLPPSTASVAGDGPVGAPDGHAWAWLAGPQNSTERCNGGTVSGTLDMETPASQPEVVATLPPGPATTMWTLGGWANDDLWLLAETGCPATGTGTTAAFIVHAGSTTLTPVQPALGNGCGLEAVALDGSMLCVTNTAKQPATTWRFVNAAATAENFSATSLPSLCAGHGTLQDFEGFALSFDGRYISVDAGCASSKGRFDQLFIISTATGTAQLVDSPTYLAADSWLPDDTLLCDDLSNPGAAHSYLVTATGTVTPLGDGEATWATTDVEW